MYRTHPEIVELREKLAIAKAVLEAVDEAYCGVGDFEGTGENMAGVIVRVRYALDKLK